VRICREADRLVDPVLTVWAELMVDWRREAKKKVHDAAARRGVLQRIAGDEMEKTLRDIGPAAAERLFAKWLAEAVRGAKQVATGAGHMKTGAARAAVARPARGRRGKAVRHAR